MAATRELVRTSDLSGTPQVWTVWVEGGWPERVTAMGDQVTNAIWSPVADLIAVEVAPGRRSEPAGPPHRARRLRPRAAHRGPWMAAVSKSAYGDPDTQREMLERLSPINRIDRVKAPLLVQHGVNDTKVPLIEAQQVVDELRKRNLEVDALIFPDEGHGFTKTANRTRAAVETVRWFASRL